MYRYRFIKTPRFQQQVPDSDSYSLIAERLCNDTWINVAVVPDVSTRRSFVSYLAQICTRGQLDPMQLMDVILDVLP